VRGRSQLNTDRNSYIGLRFVQKSMMCMIDLEQSKHVMACHRFWRKHSNPPACLRIRARSGTVWGGMAYQHFFGRLESIRTVFLWATAIPVCRRPLITVLVKEMNEIAQPRNHTKHSIYNSIIELLVFTELSELV